VPAQRSSGGDLHFGGRFRSNHCGRTFQVKYAANLTIGESYINITNTGANGASILGPGYGSENAVRIQIWISPIAVLLAQMAPSSSASVTCRCLGVIRTD
jgi:hypothetical protein